MQGRREMSNLKKADKFFLRISVNMRFTLEKLGLPMSLCPRRFIQLMSAPLKAAHFVMGGGREVQHGRRYGICVDAGCCSFWPR